ncbi:alpha/beta hydrolase [Rhizobium sp. CG5]|uniref:alpha/beta hydrolase n=1 Tax=Rhizobium sp. CG5 TaxID=2726076 RepID=UPI0020347FD9|nr:alpha/beta hydrolase-fold protein [Rhizobium sp. CG5]MCM2476478.1 alpha/beta hydrolase [Rhizobium sp. CG5]
MLNNAADRQENIVSESIDVAGCRRYRLEGKDPAQCYDIFEYVPATPPPPEGFPVFYVLDANADFLLVAETVRRLSRRPSATGVRPSIVIGIGYPGIGDYHADRRHFDFTRGPPADDALKDRHLPACGGQADFIRFLGDSLMPHVAGLYDIDRTAQVVLGHSLAGYFVLDLLCQCPGLFSGYVAVSPSIWWDRPAMLQSLETAGRDLERPLRLYTTVGEWERELAPWQGLLQAGHDYGALRRKRRMIENAEEVSRHIAEVLGAKAAVRFEIQMNEDHASTLTAALCGALRFALPR